MRGRCSVSTNSPPVKSAPGSDRSTASCNRKDVLAVKVLVQAVVVAVLVAEQQRRRADLSRRVALLQKEGMLGRIARADPHARVPIVRHRSKMRVRPGAELPDEVWQWIREIFVFATPEAMPRHDDAAAKAMVVVVERGDRFCLLLCQHAFRDRVAMCIEVGCDAVPWQIVHAPLDGVLHEREERLGRRHPFASRSSSLRLRATPQR